MESKRRRPTEAELAILRVLWEGKAQTVRAIQQVLNQARPTGYTTVLKLMQIMTEKGLVERDESCRPQIYRARYTQQQTQRQLLGDLMNRAFGGSVKALVLQALATKKSSPKELEDHGNSFWIASKEARNDGYSAGAQRGVARFHLAGAVGGFLLWAVLVYCAIIRRAPRYAVCCAALAAMALLPVVTACLLYSAILAAPEPLPRFGPPRGRRAQRRRARLDRWLGSALSLGAAGVVAGRAAVFAAAGVGFPADVRTAPAGEAGRGCGAGPGGAVRERMKWRGPCVC